MKYHLNSSVANWQQNNRDFEWPLGYCKRKVCVLKQNWSLYVLMCAAQWILDVAVLNSTFFFSSWLSNGVVVPGPVPHYEKFSRCNGNSERYTALGAICCHAGWWCNETWWRAGWQEGANSNQSAMGQVQRLCARECGHRNRCKAASICFSFDGWLLNDANRAPRCSRLHGG